ncbi:MAG: YitT family protein, partial [Fenollaria timonensis]
ELLTGLPAGIMLFAINLPIFLFGLKELDKKFLVYAFITTFVLSATMVLLRPMQKLNTFDDILISAIFGGVLNGIGMGVLFRHGACQGGLDIVAAVCKKRYNINIGSALMAMNAIIISLASIKFGVLKGLYTVISMFVAYQVLDKVQTGADATKSVMIISKDYEELSYELMNKLERGATIIDSYGGWSKSDLKIIFMLVKPREIVDVKKITNAIDPNAFITIQDTNEVKGRGFKGSDNF